MAVRPIDGNALIEWFRPYLHSDDPIPADVVIEDIRSMPTLTPPNEPMTEEQLMKRIGNPIWIESAGRAEWMLLWGYNGPEVYGRAFIFTRRTGQKASFPFSELGVTWRAYRRPPEEEEDA